MFLAAVGDITRFRNSKRQSEGPDRPLGDRAVAPRLDTLLELVRLCGLDLLLMLEPYRPVDDRPPAKLQRYSPERRLKRVLTCPDRGEGA